MIPLVAPPHDVAVYLVAVGAWISVGFLIGAFHFTTLRWAVDLLVVGEPPTALATVVAPLARFAVTAGALVVASRYFGATSLLSCAAGFLTARALMLRVGDRG